MPQPLSKVRPGAAISLMPIGSPKKAELYRWACGIIAFSSEIDLEMSLLLVRILGADATPALAMYDALRADNVKLAALSAAAKMALTKAQWPIFQAIIKIVQAAQKTRHKLAHWIWVESVDVPNALLLADPQHLREREIGQSRLGLEEDVSHYFSPPNGDHILVFRQNDLLDETKKLFDATKVLFAFKYHLIARKMDWSEVNLGDDAAESWKRLETIEGALAELMKVDLFREVYRPESDQMDQSSIHQSPTGSPARPPEEKGHESQT